MRADFLRAFTMSEAVRRNLLVLVNAVGCLLPVVRDRRVAGIITETNPLRIVRAERRAADRRSAPLTREGAGACARRREASMRARWAEGVAQQAVSRRPGCPGKGADATA